MYHVPVTQPISKPPSSPQDVHGCTVWSIHRLGVVYGRGAVLCNGLLRLHPGYRVSMCWPPRHWSVWCGGVVDVECVVIQVQLNSLLLLGSNCFMHSTYLWQHCRRGGVRVGVGGEFV